MYRIITISREFGSGGGPIGAILAHRLGWKLLDDPMREELARAAGISPAVAARFDECVDPWFHRLAKTIARGGYEGANPGAGPEPFDGEAMAAIWTKVIVEAAAIGHCVIVGRGGQCILHARADTFHVSVHAPRKFKLGLLRERFPEVKDPVARMAETDAHRAAYIRRHFDRDWTDRHLYQLVINASIGLDAAANAILAAAQLTPATA